MIQLFLSCLLSVASLPEILQEKIQRRQENLKEQESIDREIEELQFKLLKYRKKGLNAELQAQPYMLDRWHQFVEGIKDSEEDERELLKIQERLNELYKRKEDVKISKDEMHAS